MVSSTFDEAYNKCFGNGYDWEALAAEEGADGQYGLSTSYQG